jgi:hypothetical protein
MLVLCLLNNGFPGFGCSKMVFFLIEFPLRQQNICLFSIPQFKYLVAHYHTLGKLEVNFIFQG